MKHKQIELTNGKIHYWINKNNYENAKCLVFTHGLTANHAMFEKQVEYFKNEYTILTWDVPLHGLSRPYKNFSYRQTAVDLHSILEKENIDKVILVGMSMGGYPSQMFIHMYPEKVEGFIALDTTPFGVNYYSKSDLWWLKQVEPMAKWFPNQILRKSMAKSVSKTAYSYHKMVEMLAPLSKSEIVEQMGIAYGQFVKENMDIKIKVPTLILVGEYDETGKVREYCKVWSKQTGYELHIIKNAAHFANGDHPNQVNHEIEAFVLNL